MNRTTRTIDLNDYVYFAAVVSHGGFAPAGRALNEPKSKLSRRVAKLERRLGVRLVERSTRHFRVTAVGQSFYERCRAVLQDAEDAEAIVAETKAEPQGQVRFSCPTGLIEIVSRTLPVFLARYPKVRFNMLAVDRPVDLIREGIDLALRVRTELTSDSALTMRTLGRSRRLLVASPKRVRQYGADIERLASLPTLSTSDEVGEVEWQLEGPGGETRRIRHEPRMNCSDFTAVREAAIAGLGIALLPDHNCREFINDGRLVRVFPEWRGLEGNLHLVFTTRRGLPVAVRSFIDHLVKTFPPDTLSG